MNKQRIRFLLTALIAVLLAVIVAAFLLPSFYALPTIDDFANTNNVLAKRAEGLSVIETTAFLTIQALVEWAEVLSYSCISSSRLSAILGLSDYGLPCFL